MSTGCLMCAIAAGDVPVPFEHEDEEVVAVRDFDAQAPLHVVVLSRRHIPTLLAASARDVHLVGRMMLVAAQLVGASTVASGPWRVVVGEASREPSLKHLHLHLLAGRRFEWPPG